VKSQETCPALFAESQIVGLGWQNEAELRKRISQLDLPFESVISWRIRTFLREKAGRVSVIPHDAEAFARAIYAELHQSDDSTPA